MWVIPTLMFPQEKARPNDSLFVESHGIGVPINTDKVKMFMVICEGKQSCQKQLGSSFPIGKTDLMVSHEPESEIFIKPWSEMGSNNVYAVD